MDPSTPRHNRRHRGSPLNVSHRTVVPGTPTLWPVSETWLEPSELGDVAGLELVEPAHAEQPHRALDLPAQDLNGAVDAFASAGHQAVEVGATDQGEPGSVRDRRDDVLAGHDAGVEM